MSGKKTLSEAADYIDDEGRFVLFKRILYPIIEFIGSCSIFEVIPKNGGPTLNILLGQVVVVLIRTL